MEKKTRFKLKYIHSHVNKSKHFRRTNKKLVKAAETMEFPPMLLLKYFSPVTIMRTVGDFCYLDQVTHCDEYVRYSALSFHFKQIKEIKASANFTICSLQDYEEPFVSLDFLCDRLLSLNDQNSYGLACNLRRFAEKFQFVELLGKKEINIAEQEKLYSVQESNFFKLLDENKNEPIILYHYGFSQKLGPLINKMGTNKMMKALTLKNDLQFFEDGPLVIPSNDYFRYMNEHLEACFAEKNSIFRVYLNTSQGILQVFCYCYQFKIKNELVTLIIFPKSLQDEKTQKLYDIALSQQENEGKPGYEQKNMKNIDEWDKIIKKYYEPWICKEPKERCSYRTLETIDTLI